MDYENILSSLKNQRFKKVINKCKKFDAGATIYAKEIRKNIFLLFVLLKDEEDKNFHAFIANFDSVESIGVKEPLQLLFYISVKNNDDLHYFDKYMKY